MSTLYSGNGTFLANTTVTAFRAVVLSSNGGITLNSGSTKPDGFALTDAASGDYVSVKFLHNPGTQKGALSAAPITVGDVVYAALAGNVSPSGTVAIGKSLTTSAVTGSIIEFIANTL
jgi:hypothetical protein